MYSKASRSLSGNVTSNCPPHPSHTWHQRPLSHPWRRALGRPGVLPKGFHSCSVLGSKALAHDVSSGWPLRLACPMACAALLQSAQSTCLSHSCLAQFAVGALRCLDQLMRVCAALLLAFLAFCFWLGSRSVLAEVSPTCGQVKWMRCCPSRS